jgi:Uri superfamily endonuclease
MDIAKPDGFSGNNLNNMNRFPRDAGSYALILGLEKAIFLTIGRLGRYKFPPGVYVYCGSAMGSGGLRGRLGHHLKTDNRGNPHWHIDWLLPKMRTLGCCYCAGLKPLECSWSQALANLRGARVIVPHFGAGDCTMGCAAHLILCSSRIKIEFIRDVLISISGKDVEMG